MQGTWALTVRSLRQDNRLIRYHLLRFAVAGFLAVLVLTMWLYGLRVESPGHDLLSMLAYGNLFAVTIVGGFLFAPTITDGSIPQSTSTVPSMAVVELFPCVPATAIPVRPSMHLPSASA